MAMATDVRLQRPVSMMETLMQALYDLHGEVGLTDAAQLTEEVLQETLQRTCSRTGADGERPAGQDRLVFHRQGHAWRIELSRRRAVVPHSVGMAYLEVLVANPGYDVSAVELAADHGLSGTPAAARSTGSSDPVLDETARRAYRERLAALEADVEEHQANHDLARMEQAQAEREWLINELVAATGLGGRARIFSNNDERARISVGKAIRRAIAQITIAEPVIGDLLRTTVQTGARCSYRPN